MSDLPSYNPKESETIEDIPERFLVDGYLKLRADGAWLFRGEKIKHRGLQQFLSRQLRRTQEGQYWVVNGPQRALVEIEDAPFLVKRIEFDKEPKASATMLATLSDGSQEILRPETFFMSEEGVLYTRVQGRQTENQTENQKAEDHLARISANALLDIEALFVELEEQNIALQYQGKTYPLG